MDDDAVFVTALLLIVVLFYFFGHTVCFSVGRLNGAAGGLQHNMAQVGRPVTVTANNILFDSDFIFIPETKQVLEQLSDVMTIYLIVQVANAEAVTSTRGIVDKSLADIIPSDRILFCETAVGRSFMARQLEAALHIECDPDVAHLNAIFCPTALISSNGECPSARFRAASLRELFAIHGRSLSAHFSLENDRNHVIN